MKAEKKDYYYSWFNLDDGSVAIHDFPAHHGPTTRKDIEDTFSVDYIDRYLPGEYVVYGTDEEMVRSGRAELRLGGSLGYPKPEAIFGDDEYQKVLNKWRIHFGLGT